MNAPGATGFSGEAPSEDAAAKGSFYPDKESKYVDRWNDTNALNPEVEQRENYSAVTQGSAVVTLVARIKVGGRKNAMKTWWQ